jgi:hypothetical protein
MQEPGWQEHARVHSNGLGFMLLQNCPESMNERIEYGKDSLFIVVAFVSLCRQQAGTVC